MIEMAKSKTGMRPLIRLISVYMFKNCFKKNCFLLGSTINLLLLQKNSVLIRKG